MSSATAKRGPARRPMFVASFYSYKGGVGRSVALMNTAQQLASSGRRVVMLDFDLEAPGLHSTCNAVWRDAIRKDQPGFIDFFSEYISHPSDVPPIADYISSEFGPGRLISLVPAGNLSEFESYSAKLLTLNDELLAPETCARELLLKLRDDLADMGFDYLLVDCRTGHTDILGASTVLLPHLVIFVTNLSAQSLIGTRSVLKWVRIASDAAVAKMRPPAETAGNRFFLRSINDPAIQTLIVASPVPLGEHSAVAEAERDTDTGLGRAFNHIIYYVPQIAAHEKQHVAKNSAEDPVQQYRRLADKVRALNPFEPSTMVEYGMESLERQDWTRALSYFDAAEHFLPGDKLGESDRRLNVRRRYGEVRALALGFQTEKAQELLDKIEKRGIPSGMKEESLAANVQMVRGYLASDSLDQALRPAKKALEHAQALGERQGRISPWEILARLQLGDVHCFLGQMVEAEAAVQDVPKQAAVLNRAMERVKAYQLLATAQALQASNAKFSKAEDNLRAASEQAETLGVPYLIAGCAFVRSVIDLTRGNLLQKNVKELEKASEQYVREGDGLSAADCLAELAIYLHRLGSEDELTIDKHLKEAWRRYRNIAGTSLGRVNVLLYVAEIKTDRGELVSADDKKWKDLRKEYKSSAMGALAEAFRIADSRKLPDAIKNDIAVWIGLLHLFLSEEPRSLAPEDKAGKTSAQVSKLIPGAVARKRNAAFRELLKSPTPEKRDMLDKVAQEAGRRHLGYNEAIARTLVALGSVRLGEAKHRDAQIDRIHNLVKDGNLGWSIWGQVHNVQRHFQGEDSDKWIPAASSLLAIATERGLLKLPPCWLKNDK